MAAIQLVLHERRPASLRAGDVAFLGLGAGFSLMIAALFGLALIHQLTATGISVVFAALSALAIVAILMYRQRNRSTNIERFKPGPQHLAECAFVLLLLVLQYASVSPPSLGDSTSFHLPYADVFISHRGLAVDEHLIYPYMSLNGSMLYSLALLLEHHIVFAQTINALFATLSMYGIYRFCLFTKQPAWIAMLASFLFLSIYPVHIGRYSAYVDLMAMFFILSCVFALIAWSHDRNTYTLLLVSAIALGIAMGTKYIMAIFSFPIAIYICWLERKRAMKPLFIYATCAALWGLWWYIRNAIMTGNPVHPFAPGIFGYYLWDAEDLKRQFMGLNLGYVPQQITGLLLAPAFAYFNHILMEQHIFHVLVALYLSAALVCFSDKDARALLLFCFCFLCFWVFGTSDPRYLLPVIPLVFVYAGSVTSGILRRMENAPLLLGLAATLALMAGFVDIREKYKRVAHIPITTAAAHEQLLRENPTYDLISQANREFGVTGRVFEFYYRDGRFFSDNTLLGTQFGPHAYWRLLNEIRSDRDGVVHYDPKKLERVLETRYAADGFIIPQPSYFKNHYDPKEFEAVFTLVYQNSDGAIYRLRASEDPAKP